MSNEGVAPFEIDQLRVFSGVKPKFQNQKNAVQKRRGSYQQESGEANQNRKQSGKKKPLLALDSDFPPPLL